MTRLTHKEYFFRVVEAVALRSTCDRGRSGAVLVKENRIIATGYVGSPPGMPHCDEIGHNIQDGSCVNTIHAEWNALLQIVRHGGPSTVGAEMYCTMCPCFNCASAIVSAGIVAVHAIWDYHKSARSKQLFIDAGVNCTLEHGGCVPYGMDHAHQLP
jgi:dCMP deaminase